VVLISPSSQRPSLGKEASRNNRPAYPVPSYRRTLLDTSLDSARYRIKVSAIAFGVESGRSVHGHSADGIDGLGVGYIDGFNFLRCCDVNFGADLKKNDRETVAETWGVSPIRVSMGRTELLRFAPDKLDQVAGNNSSGVSTRICSSVPPLPRSEAQAIIESISRISPGRSFLLPARLSPARSQIF